MKTSEFDYDLPLERIAQHPVEPRDSSRLLVYDRKTDRIEHAIFREIGNYLNAGDLLVRNRTRVIPARLLGFKMPTGGKIELLLLKRIELHTWEVMVGGKGMVAGRRFGIPLEDGAVLEGHIAAELDGSRRIVHFDSPIVGELPLVGHMPLPPYIREPLEDPDRYQTVYAEEAGSAAAPTAGLHFTPELLERLKASGLRIADSTLHVGLDTFAPVHESTPSEHIIHSEWCHLPQESADAILETRLAGGRVVCIGTTSVRTVESAAQSAGQAEIIKTFEGPTNLYILPGYTFKAVDAIVTNFHVPKSTLLMLVSAFAGRERMLEIYQLAIDEGYRFFSFGDAMLIL